MDINAVEVNVSPLVEPVRFGRIFQRFSGPKRIKSDESLRLGKSNDNLRPEGLGKSLESSPGGRRHTKLPSSITSKKDFLISKKDEEIKWLPAELEHLRSQMKLTQNTSGEDDAQQVEDLRTQLMESRRKTKKLEKKLQHVLKEKNDLEGRIDLFGEERYTSMDLKVSTADGSSSHVLKTHQLQLSERDNRIMDLTIRLQESRLLNTSVQKALSTNDKETQLILLLEQKERELREKDFQLSRIRHALKISQQKIKARNVEPTDLERDATEMISFLESKLVELSRALVFSQSLLEKEKVANSSIENMSIEKVVELEPRLGRYQQAHSVIEGDAQWKEADTCAC